MCWAGFEVESVKRGIEKRRGFDKSPSSSAQKSSQRSSRGSADFSCFLSWAVGFKLGLVAVRQSVRTTSGSSPNSRKCPMLIARELIQTCKTQDLKRVNVRNWGFLTFTNAATSFTHNRAGIDHQRVTVTPPHEVNDGERDPGHNIWDLPLNFLQFDVVGIPVLEEGKATVETRATELNSHFALRQPQTTTKSPDEVTLRPPYLFPPPSSNSQLHSHKWDNNWNSILNCPFHWSSWQMNPIPSRLSGIFGRLLESPRIDL
jgi:hypothetical protein